MQKASIDAIRKISELTGVNVEIFESSTDEKGKYIGENGSYDAATNTIRVDINAGRTSVTDAIAPVMLKTMSHELTHYIQRNSPEMYEELKSFVSNHLIERGKNLEDLARAKKESAEFTGQKMTYDQAMDEVIADACEDMLQNTTAIDTLARENRNLAEKIRDWLRDFHNLLKKAFSGEGYRHEEAEAMLDKADELQKLWDAALVKAAENQQRAQSNRADQETADQQNAEEYIQHSTRVTDPDVFPNEARVQYSSRGQNNFIEDDPLYPKSERDQHAFIRSFANKTNTLKNGDRRVILVFTANNAYLVDANGYLSGKIRYVYDMNDEQDIKEIREVKHNAFQQNETAHMLPRRIRDGRRRSGWDSADIEERGEGGRDAGVDGEPYYRKPRRSLKERLGNYASQLNDEDTQYSFRSPEDISGRDLLANALKTVAQNEAERQAGGRTPAFLRGEKKCGILPAT